jgi:hypothetical protein
MVFNRGTICSSVIAPAFPTLCREEALVSELTMRPRWYSGPCLAPLCLLLACIVAGVFSHGAFFVAAILAVGWVIAQFSTRIEVTPGDVGLKIWLFRRKPAPRDEIKAMHWYEQQFRFVDEDQRALLGIPSFGWTRGQLLDLSEALGVPIV